MQTSLAQMVALVCHGNVALRGEAATGVSLAHSTCQFCEFVQYIAGGKAGKGEAATVTLAESSEIWLQQLGPRGILGLRLHQRAQNIASEFPDRMSSAFAGGGRLWRIEGLRRDGTSEFWLSKWEVGNRDATDRRIWRVTYGLCEVSPTTAFNLRSLSAILSDLRGALTEIRAFSEVNHCGGFTRCFEVALTALDNPNADIGYHKDLYPPGKLNDLAVSLLKAAQSAWVFGGMGSWNDMGFEGSTQAEYERVSERLFELLNEAVEAAVTSSMSNSV